MLLEFSSRGVESTENVVFVARVLAEGRITVPYVFRDLLGLRKGDYVRVRILEVIRR